MAALERAREKPKYVPVNLPQLPPDVWPLILHGKHYGGVRLQLSSKPQAVIRAVQEPCSLNCLQTNAASMDWKSVPCAQHTAVEQHICARQALETSLSSLTGPIILVLHHRDPTARMSGPWFAHVCPLWVFRTSARSVLLRSCVVLNLVYAAAYEIEFYAAAYFELSCQTLHPLPGRHSGTPHSRTPLAAPGCIHALSRVARLAGQMDDSGKQASYGELPSQLDAHVGLEQDGTTYCDNLFDDTLEFATHDNPYEALPLSNFNNSGFEDDTAWNFAVYNLALDNSSSAEQCCDVSQSCVKEVPLNANAHTPNGNIASRWPATEQLGQDADINGSPEETNIPADISAAGSPSYQPIICHSRKKPKTKPGKVHDGQIPLVCPFQRLDAHEYHKCSKYVLRRIKDVKQHIYRCHTQPEYYCALCFNVFESARERDDHIRRAGCNKISMPWFHGISGEQRRRLGRKASSAMGTEEQWFEIWEVIFPGQGRPRSVWVGSPSEEAVLALRSMWKNRGTSILEDVLGDSGGVGSQPLVLDTAMNSIFNRLEAQSASSPGDNGTLSPT